MPKEQVPEIKVGQEWKGSYGNIKIMATANNYAMVRIKGCMPFAISFSDLPKRYSLKTS